MTSIKTSKTPSQRNRKPAAPKKAPPGAARLPHERDESTDSQEASPQQREVGQQAHDDVQAGQLDTGSAPVTDRTYQKLK